MRQELLVYVNGRWSKVDRIRVDIEHATVAFRVVVWATDGRYVGKVFVDGEEVMKVPIDVRNGYGYSDFSLVFSSTGEYRVYVDIHRAEPEEPIYEFAIYDAIVRVYEIFRAPRRCAKLRYSIEVKDLLLSLGNGGEMEAEYVVEGIPDTMLTKPHIKYVYVDTDKEEDIMFFNPRYREPLPDRFSLEGYLQRGTSSVVVDKIYVLSVCKLVPVSSTTALVCEFNGYCNVGVELTKIDSRFKLLEPVTIDAELTNREDFLFMDVELVPGEQVRMVYCGAWEPTEHGYIIGEIESGRYRYGLFIPSSVVPNGSVGFFYGQYDARIPLNEIEVVRNAVLNDLELDKIQWP